MPSPFYRASVVLFHLHGGMVSHMQVLPIPLQLCIILNTWILTTETMLVLAVCSWGSDVGYSIRHWQASWHNFRIAGSGKLIPCFRTFREAFSHPYISVFHLLVNGFCVTNFRTCFADPLPSLYWWAVSVGREELKWHQLAHQQLMSLPRTLI